MRRRRLVSLVAAAPLFSGCSTVPWSDERTSQSGDSVLADRDPPSRDELPTETRPPAERPPDTTADTVSPRPYPTRPAEYTDRSVRTFVRSHERALRRNESLAGWGGSLVSQRSTFDWSITLAADGDAGVGRCQYSYSEAADDDDDHVVGAPATNVVTYYVDDSVIVRARDSGSVDRRDELHPDPWESGVALEPVE